MDTLIRRLLIANRGEIALRIVRACREAGIESVAVYSEADVDAPHAIGADRAVGIGPAPARESYLSIDAILDAARRSGADAIHPGYGFLSENAAFAQACADRQLTFVGPPAAVIARMGSKIAARAAMAAAGVPVVRGTTPDDQGDAGLARAADHIGYPVLIKAASGGGGRGMKVARTRQDLVTAVPSARREAQAAFGDGTLYVERLLERSRHVEVQILADRHGQVLHLFERECSLQRRHQKVVEESPAPALTPAVRGRLAQAAVAVARAVGYENAGTVEFLLEGSGDAARFYFLEMNTRLQVEHPVTEAVTGIDLVRAQLAVAAGDPLSLGQEAVVQRGHAIQARLYAEDPAREFLPQAGRLLLYRQPAGPGVRVDAGVTDGTEVTVHYDPLLAKVIVHAETRQAAIARLIAALRRYVVLGVRTNLPFLIELLTHPDVAAGHVHTEFVEQQIGSLLTDRHDGERVAALAAAVAWSPSASGRLEPPEADRSAWDPWGALRGWRS